MGKRCRLLVFLLVLFLASGLPAEENHPRVALVLGGGGARGFAAVPIIAAIEAHGIPVDMVLGTSMGALVGAMYACGYSPREMDAYASSHDFLNVILESSDGQAYPGPEVFRDRRDNFASIGISGGDVTGTPGLLGDTRLLKLLSDMYAPQSGVRDFDDLPIPFRAVATDVETGERKVFDHGSLTDAVRSSISIPMVFAPYPQEGGSSAMDGGLVDNLPIRLAKELGADIVIAVDFNYDEHIAPGDIRTIIDSFVEWTVITTQEKDQHPYADLLLLPEDGMIKTLDYDKYEEIAAIGKACAEEHEEDFARLAKEIQDAGRDLVYKDPERTVASVAKPAQTISSVTVRDRSLDPRPHFAVETHAFDKYVGRALDSKTREELAKTMTRVKNSFDLASIGFDTEDTDEGVNLVIGYTAYPAQGTDLMLGGYPSLGFSNNGPDSTWFWAYPDFSADLRWQSPLGFSADAWIAIAPAMEAGGRIRLPFVYKGGHTFGGLFTARAKGGSLSVHTHWGSSQRDAGLDRSGVLDTAFFYTYGQLFELQAGTEFSWDWIADRGEMLAYPRAYASFTFDNRHQYHSLTQGGIRADVRFTSEWEEYEKSGWNYAFEALMRQDIEIAVDQVMLGWEGQVRWMRLQDGLLSSYVDIGGIDGFPGYAYGSLRQDAAWGSVRIRTRIATVLGMPFYFAGKISAGVIGGEDPFEDDTADGAIFSDDPEWEVGTTLGFAVSTIVGNFFAGGGYALHSGNWNLMVGVIL